ncbi:hypothetical protein SDC9_104020 [bioreactor metagenome]|uniref:Uncharacterized protein n=1 Tax=bioreactor metagenome TaxID=1076179 RepID=A0A645AWP6_9ZZZZ
MGVVDGCQSFKKIVMALHILGFPHDGGPILHKNADLPGAVAQKAFHRILIVRIDHDINQVRMEPAGEADHLFDAVQVGKLLGKGRVPHHIVLQSGTVGKGGGGIVYLFKFCFQLLINAVVNLLAIGSPLRFPRTVHADILVIYEYKERKQRNPENDDQLGAQGPPNTAAHFCYPSFPVSACLR